LSKAATSSIVPTHSSSRWAVISFGAENLPTGNLNQSNSRWLFGYMVIWLYGYMVIWLLVIGYLVNGYWLFG